MASCSAPTPSPDARDRFVIAAVPGGPDQLVSGEVDGVTITLTARGKVDRLERFDRRRRSQRARARRACRSARPVCSADRRTWSGRSSTTTSSCSRAGRSPRPGATRTRSVPCSVPGRSPRPSRTRSRRSSSTSGSSRCERRCARCCASAVAPPRRRLRRRRSSSTSTVTWPPICNCSVSSVRPALAPCSPASIQGPRCGDSRSRGRSVDCAPRSPAWHAILSKKSTRCSPTSPNCRSCRTVN